MIRNSSAQHHADHLGTRRNRDPGQFLHGREVSEIVHHAAQIIHAIGVRNIGMPGLALAHLLRAAVMESDLGHGIDDLLAVELNHNPQDAVRARMLRAEVQKDEIGCRHGYAACPTLRGGSATTPVQPPPSLRKDGTAPSPWRERGGLFSADVLSSSWASGCAAGEDARKKISRTCPILRARTSSPPARDP